MTIPSFPTLPGLAWPITRSPKWSVIKQPAISGRETRLGLWSYPLYSYEFAYDLLRQAPSLQEWQTLEAFYNQQGGSAGLFQYADPNDGAVTAQGFGTGDGTTTSFQLVRSLGGFAAPVFAPLGVPTITVAGSPTSGFSLEANGIVIFASAPANGAALAWSGNFAWLCRFDNDSVAFSNFASGLWELKKLSFTTVKP